MMSANQAAAQQIGRLESVFHEVTLASERLAIARLPRRRLASLLNRPDRREEARPELNLLDVQRVPYPWLSELAELVADLPFEFPLQMDQWPSPIASLDVVFDIQDGLLRSMRGNEADDEPLETAS
jgi:hypothetical protein